MRKTTVTLTLMCIVVSLAATQALATEPTAAAGPKRVAITDPAELAGLGFAPTAKNVFRLVGTASGTEGDQGGAQGFGVQGSHYFTVSALSFLPHSSAFEWTSMFGYDMYRLSASPSGNTAQVQLMLETGVQLRSVVVYGYDYDTTENLFASVQEVCQALGADPVATVLDSDSTSGSIGNNLIILDWTPDTTVQGTCAYIVRVRFDVANSNIGLQSALVQWRRQIKTGPVTPTFSDVPASHQMYDEIEALADSGVTAGCTATDFCPGNYVTRAQMAAFLARALGLHYQ